MMEHLERKIKDKLQQNRVEINTDELWNEVYPHISPKKDRRVLLYLMFGLIWLVSVVSVAWYFGSEDQGSSLITDTIKSNQREISVNTKNIETSVLKNEAPTDREEKVISFEHPSETTNIESPEISIDQKINIQKKNAGILSQRITETTKANKNSKLQQDLNVASSVFISTKNEDAGNFSGGDFLLEKLNKFVEDSAETKEVTKSDKKYFPSTLTLKNIDPIEYIYPQPTIPNELVAYEQSSDFSRFSVYALGGIYAVNRSLTANVAEPPANLVSRRASESPLESLSSEFGINYRLSENLMLSAGLNYTRINEKIEDTYAEIDTVLLENVIIEYIISSRGSEPVYGNVLAERTVNTSLTAFNRYTDISISFDLTYFLNNRKFTPYFSLGLQQSLRSMQSGYWLLDGSLYDLSNDDNGYLSSKYGLGVRAGVGGHLSLSQRTKLLVGARYSQYLSPITNQNYELKQRYNLLGLHAGFIVKI